jgi:hypothetical protein
MPLDSSSPILGRLSNTRESRISLICCYCLSWRITAGRRYSNQSCLGSRFKYSMRFRDLQSGPRVTARVRCLRVTACRPPLRRLFLQLFTIRVSKTTMRKATTGACPTIVLVARRKFRTASQLYIDITTEFLNVGKGASPSSGL